MAYPERGQICVKNPKANDSEPPKDFFFDAVFDDKVEQKHIYDVCASGVVESVLNGYNGTIFAYGQTGAGKVSLGDRNALMNIESIKCTRLIT